jgi:hypothetical protein
MFVGCSNFKDMFRILVFSHWNLFDICDLEFGI